MTKALVTQSKSIVLLFLAATTLVSCNDNTNPDATGTPQGQRPELQGGTDCSAEFISLYNSLTNSFQEPVLTAQTVRASSSLTEPLATQQLRQTEINRIQGLREMPCRIVTANSANERTTINIASDDIILSAMASRTQEGILLIQTEHAIRELDQATGIRFQENEVPRAGSLADLIDMPHLTQHSSSSSQVDQAQRAVQGFRNQIQALQTQSSTNLTFTQNRQLTHYVNASENFLTRLNTQAPTASLVTVIQNEETDTQRTQREQRTEEEARIAAASALREQNLANRATEQH